MRLLVTRPEPDAERTAAALRARGHSVVIAPLLRIEPLADAAIGAGPWAAVLVTSANIAHAIAGHAKRADLTHLPVFAVGERSAHAMRIAGLRPRHFGRRQRRRSRQDRRRASQFAGAATLSRRRAALRRPWRRTPHQRFCGRDRCDLSRSHCRYFAAGGRGRLGGRSSTACCISHAAAPRPMWKRHAPRTCSKVHCGRRISACPPRSRRRCKAQVAALSASPANPPKPRCSI